MPLNAVPLDLAALADHSLEAIARLQEERNVSLTVAIDERPARVIGDPDRLEQIIINLLDNASKFANQEDPRVLLRLFKQHQHIYLCVEDNGVGIDGKAREQVFEKFNQLLSSDNSTSKRPKGSGLGLPISRAIATHLGGRLWVENAQVLNGACFVLELSEAATSLDISTDEH